MLTNEHICVKIKIIFANYGGNKEIMMKKCTKKALSCLIAVILVMLSVAIAPIKASAAIIMSGAFGDNLTWTLDDNGLLTISGTGDMWDYNYLNNQSPLRYYYFQLFAVQIHDGVTSIGNDTFESCSRLESITIPDTVISIGIGAFCGCDSLMSITIPDGVTYIGSEAFEGCSSLTSIKIPDGVTDIEDYTFLGCRALESITIPDSVTNIGNEAFYNCRTLTDIAIPNSVTYIGSGAFEECRALTSIKIPDGVTRIEDRTFSRCSALTSITIPDSVTYIGEEAFLYCDRLTIYGDSGSYAERYANEYNIPFAVLTSCENDAHTYGAWSTVTAATCTDEGLERRTCENCFASETRKIEALAHDYIDEVTPPTSNEQGYTTHTCSRCADTYIDSYTDPIATYILGDVNGDKEINGDDVSDLSRYVAKWPDTILDSILAADVNGDGEINGDDISDLSRYIAKWPGSIIG